MSQPETDKALAAEGRSQETRSFVCAVKATTRRKYTSEEKIRIVLEGFRREATVSDLCRREGIKPHSYYSCDLTTENSSSAGESLPVNGDHPRKQTQIACQLLEENL